MLISYAIYYCVNTEGQKEHYPTVKGLLITAKETPHKRFKIMVICSNQLPHSPAKFLHKFSSRSYLCTCDLK